MEKTDASPFSTDIRRENITAQEVLSVLKRWRASIIILVLVATAAATLLSVVLPKKYVATTLLSPTSGDSGSGQLGALTNMLSSLGDIGNVSGLSLGGSGRRAEFIAVLGSEGLTSKFIQNNGLIQVLARTDDRINSIWKAVKYFREKVRTISTDTKTGLVSLTVEWRDPTVAASWANGLVTLANEYLRGKAIAEGERNISYLNQQAARTDFVQERQVIYSVMQSELSKVMLAKGNDEYALKVIDKAIPPEKASSPRPMLWIGGTFFGALALSVLVAICKVSLFGI